jgi:hypothetical protein
MKKLIFVLSCLIFTGMVYSQDMAEAKTSLNTAGITFTDKSYDFGKVKPNTTISHTFTFTNTGSVPLIIHRVSTSCGCTASEYPKEAILPNKSAEIVLTYNASSTGVFSKSAVVYSNASDEQVVLLVKGTVE